jgi:threonine dehydrogenase-like Zn-dependent dehydrogenase
MKTITIRGVRGRHRDDVKAALRIIESGRFPRERLFTHVMPLDQTESALRLVARESGGDPIHVVVVPQPTPAEAQS